MTSRRGVALVLGAGGTVGMAYHAGSLRALQLVGGVDPAGCDLIMGTSAGSVIGAYLRSGWTSEDLWQLALGTHPMSPGYGPDDVEARRRAIFTPAWRTPAELAGRAVGSAYVIARSMFGVPPVALPRAVRRLFPGGMFTLEEGRRRFAEELPEGWPERELWIVAFDIRRRRRVVLGREGSPEVTLPRAVLASCAIPGVYPPVRVGSHLLVDGGVRSTTHLDLASKAGHELIIGVAPMAFDPAAAPPPLRQLIRGGPTRALAREAARARAAGAEVLLVRPTPAELALHGANMMRPDAGEAIARAAYESTARLLETDRFRAVLAARGAA